ncbi:MAG: hypothetical protein OEY09_11515 [Gammaproteobacteria bacterium]|nr:hypothetical protein [Gammaproteobacteria bacterium]
MNKDINEASVDISRRSILGRLGLAASVAIAAPVLMTMSAPALANHKKKDQGCNGKGGENSGNDQATANNACPEAEKDNDGVTSSFGVI